MRRLISVPAVLLGVACGLARAHADPFTGGHAVPGDAGAFFLAPAGFVQALAHVQMQLNETISRQFRSIHDTGSAAAILTVLAVAFLYGVLHAAGPGHGKTVVGSYFVANDARWVNGVVMGSLISIFQGLTAIAMVFLMSLFLHARELQVANQGALVDCVSYGIVVAIGVVLFWQAATGRGCGHAHGPGGHGHLQDSHDDVVGPPWRFRRVLIAASGVAPCASAIIIMLFALANDAMGVGVAAVLALSLGMAVTVSAFGMVGIVARRLLLRVTRHPGVRVQRVERRLRLLGSAAIVGFAGLLMIGAWSRL